MDLSKLRTDKAMGASGVWVEVLDGVKVKVIATSSAEFKKFAQSQMKPFQSLGIDPTVEDADTLGAKAFALCATKDWEGVEVDGQIIPFSTEAALKLYQDIPEFLALVVRAATNLDNFRNKQIENVSGN